MFMKKFGPQGVVCPCPWAIYMYMTIIFKHFPLGNRLANQSQIFFSETIVVYYIKVGRCSQLNEYMKLYEYQRSRLAIDFDPNHSDSIFFLNLFSSITLILTYPQHSGERYRTNGPLFFFFFFSIPPIPVGQSHSRLHSNITCNFMTCTL